VTSESSPDDADSNRPTAFAFAAPPFGTRLEVTSESSPESLLLSYALPLDGLRAEDALGPAVADAVDPGIAVPTPFWAPAPALAWAAAAPF